MKALQSITELFKLHISDSKNFSVWAEDGAMFCGQSDVVDGYESEYTIIIFMTSVSVQPHVLMMHLVNWLNINDIDRAEKGLAAPNFAVELLDKGLCDIKIKIDIREEFKLVETKTGDWEKNGQRYDCVSTFSPRVQDEDLDFLNFVGYPLDLPCD